MTLPTIRPARAADAPALTACINAAYARYAESIPDLPDVSGGIAGDIAHAHVWVVEWEGHIVAGLVLIHTPPGAKLANVAVAPEAGGQGLGRALIAVAEQQARDLGCPWLDLTTHVNMPANLRLYDKLGWQVTSHTGNSVHMRKAL